MRPKGLHQVDCKSVGQPPLENEHQTTGVPRSQQVTHPSSRRAPPICKLEAGNQRTWRSLPRRNGTFRENCRAGAAGAYFLRSLRPDSAIAKLCCWAHMTPRQQLHPTSVQTYTHTQIYIKMATPCNNYGSILYEPAPAIIKVININIIIRH